MAEKKSFVLRISPELFSAIQAIAEQEFRSVNGQIEFVISEHVRQNRGGIADPAQKSSPSVIDEGRTDASSAD